MSKVFKLIGIAAIVAVIGFSMTTCSSGDSDIDSEIVGIWYTSQVNANAGNAFTVQYNFKADGKLEYKNSTNLRYTAKGNKLTMYSSGVAGKSSATYRIIGTMLSITNAGNSGFAGGNYYKPSK
jgi:hypothetical protein